MKKVIFVLLALFACKKESSQPTPAPTPTPPPVVHVTKPGNVIFYSRDSSANHIAEKTIEIWLDYKGQTDKGKYLGKTYYFISSGTPAPYCGSYIGINWSDTVFKSHNYHAKQTVSPYLTWDGSFTLKEDTCIKIEFFTHD